MQTDILRRYLSEKVSQIQDESMLLALKTIIDKELEYAEPKVQAEQDHKPDTPAPGGQQKITPISEEEVDKPLIDGVLKESKDKAIEDWLKNL